MSELLVEVVRGPLVESRHYGDVAVVDRSGQVLWAVGDPERVTYARSAAKPLQALPLVESGAADHFRMTSEELALACASHSGEEVQAERVRALLQRIGIDESYLRCGVHPPYHVPSYEQLLRAGSAPGAIHNNCSGKHAGMLALAKYLGADLEGYLDMEHPVQRQIRDAVAEVCEVAADKLAIGIDGCGVPVFGMPIRNLALAYAKLADPSGLPARRAEALRRLYDAMTRHPELVAGTERFCTALMQAGRGDVVGKVGTEGVYCVGLREKGWGICVKVDDGNARAAYPTVVETLRQLGVLSPDQLVELSTFLHPELRTHQGTLVGHIRPVFTLRSR
jgi:L-asparaginase II